MQLCGFILLMVLCCAHSKLLSTTCRDIRAYVNGHNVRRSRLAKGQVAGQPGANNMNYMVWDQELANKAAKWASTLRHNHNPDRTIASGRFRTGENLYWHSTTDPKFRINIDNALSSWFDEHTDYTFGPYTSYVKGTPQIGHYTQMAWADTTYVGCAVSQWKEGRKTTHFLVCNYGPPGNFLGKRPYTSSKNGSGKIYCSIGGDKCSKPFGNSCQKS